MKFLFEDDTFSFDTLRTTGFANYFGADLGEVLAAADRIHDGDQGGRHREWKATAGRGGRGWNGVYITTDTSRPTTRSTQPLGSGSICVNRNTTDPTVTTREGKS